MRQIVKTHTWLLETIYDNNITVQEVSHGQDVLVRGLDHLEKLNLQRLGAMKVSCLTFGEDLLTICSLISENGRKNQHLRKGHQSHQRKYDRPANRDQ